MGAIGVVNRFSKLKDVAWERTDASPVQQGDVPHYEAGSSKLVMGPPAGGGGGSFSLGVSNIGNTLGDTGITGSRVVLAATGNLTLSQATDVNGGTILISAGTQSAAAFSAGISGGNTAGDTGLTGTHLAFAGGNAITLSGATNAGGGTITIAAPGTSVLSAVAPLSTSTNGSTISILGPPVVDVSIGGNTAGVPALISSGTVTLAGGSNITVSQNGNAISIIAGATAVETQTAISGIANSQTTYTSGTVKLSELGAVTIRSTTGNQFQISVNSQSVQPETQTFLGGVAASNTTYTSGTVSIVGSGIVTVQSGTGQRVIINASQSVQPETQTFIGGIIASDTTYTSGSVRFTGVGGGVTVSSNTGQRVDISVAAPVAQTVQTQNVVDVTAAGNTAGALALVSSGTLTLAGGNSITLSQAGNAITISGATTSQSVQTQNLHNVTISGNTAGALAAISSGTMTLAGGNNITLSQAGNAITISGANAGGAQTGISGIANSQTTYTSGTVSLSELGAITIRSTTGNQFQFSVAAQTAESQSIGMSNIGNTSGTTGIASGAQVRMLFAGGNNVTLSQSLNGASGTITISAAAQTNQAGSLFAVGNTTSSTSGTYDARTLSLRGDGIISIAATNSGFRISATQSVQPETQTFVGGIIASDTTYTSGSIRFTGVGGGVTVSSNTGQRVDISVAAQTGTQFSAGLTNSGNTSGDTGTVGGRLLLVGTNNITLSGSTNGASMTITMSGPSVAGAQTGISGIAASNTTYTSGTVTFTGVGGGITVSSNTGQRIDLSVAAQSAESQSIGMSNLGNTSGTTGIASGAQVRMLFAGGNNITLSQSLNGASGTITISAPNAQTGISGVANSQTTYTSGTVSLSELGAITIRSTTGNQYQFSVAAQTAESQSFGMSNIGNTSGATGIASGAQLRFLLAGGNNITLSQSLNGASGTITISAPNAQTAISGIAASNTTYTSGTVTITGVGGGVTVSSNTGQRIDISVAAQSVQTQNLHNVTLSGNTAGVMAQISSGTMTLAGGNNITLSQAGNAVTISGGAGGAFSAGVSTDGNTDGATGVSGTRMVLVGSGVMTLSQTTGAAGNTVSILAPATSVLSAVAPLSTTTNGSTISILAPASSLLSAVAPLSTSTNGSTISILGPPSFSAGVSTMGNTLGDTGTTGSRLVFAGINNITLSQSTNASGGTVTISGPSVAGAQTGISGIANSQTTYTSGTVSLSELGAITIRSTTGNQFQLSVNAQTVESQSFGMSNIGNTSGTTGIASGGQVRFLFAGGNRITLSQSLNGASGTITISGADAQTGISGIANSQTTYTSGTVSLSELGAITIRSTTGNQYQFSVNAQSVQPETQTFIGGIAASDTTYTSGTVRFTGVGGGITVSSNTGQRVDLSVAAQTAESQSIGMSNIGNTSGTTGIASGAQVRMLFAGGNNVTLSQSLNGASGTITISAAAQTVESQSIGMSNLGNTAGTTGIASGGQVRFLIVGSDNVTLSQSLNGASGTLSISGNPAFSAGASNLGNTAGNTGVTGTRLVVVGSNNITLSQTTGAAGATLSIIGAAGGAFSAGISGGNTSGDTGATGSRVVFAGGNNITLSGATDANGGTVTISAFTQSAESQSIGMSNLGNTSGTTGIASGAQVRMLFAGGNNITLSQSLNGASGTITISAPNAQTGISGIANSQTTYTSGTVSLSELGAITIRSTTGNQYQFSVNAQTGTQFSAGLSNLGNTSGDTVTVGGRLILAGSNGITLSGSSNGASQTITISGITQSVESQSIGASNLGNTLGTSGVASGGQVRMVILGTSNITVSQSLNGASGTMSLIGQPSFSAGLSTGGNTQGNTGVTGTRLVLVATNNITMSQNTDASGATISISGQSPTGGQFSGGISNLGNTAGSTGVSGTRLVLVGTNAISLSQSTDANGATVSFNDTVSAFQAGISTGGNTAGDTGVTGTRLVLVGSSPMSLSQATGANGGTITINAPATSSLSAVSGIKISTNGSTISIGYGLPIADWENMPRAQASLISHVSGFSKTPIYWNDEIYGDITAKSLAFAISMVTASQPLSVSAHLGIYTFVNSTSMALLGSVSEAYVVSSASSVSLSGVRNLVMTGIGTHTALSVLTGGEYAIGMMFSATATNAMNFSILGASGGAGPLGGIYPGTNQLSTGTNQGIQTLAGRGSVTVNAMPANVAASDIINQGTAASMALHPWIYIRS